MDDLGDQNQLNGLHLTPWTFGHGVPSSRSRVRVLPGARLSVLAHVPWTMTNVAHRSLSTVQWTSLSGS
jgi:hypothetical protein